MIVRNKDIMAQYTINCISGHFKNETKTCDCPEYDKFILQGVRNCGICSSYYIEHHWIEMVEKRIGKKYMIDFTSIQFENIQEKIFEQKYKTQKSLFEFIKDNSCLIFDSKHNRYKYYISNNIVIDGQKLFHETRKLYSQEKSNEIIDLFEYMNLQRVLK